MAKWYLAIPFVFLLAQIYGTAHAAEYGADPHEHGGVPCAVQFLSQTAESSGAPPASIIAGPPRFRVETRFPSMAVRHPQPLVNQHSIRGPPPVLL